MNTLKDKSTYIVAALSGVLFAIGLGISGMTDPTKVIGFLDFLGDWKPELAFVMGGGVVVYAIFYPLVTKRKTTFLGVKWSLPGRRDLTPRLLAGSALFGIGWGLGGFCPGPALTSIPTMMGEVAVFVGAMVGGMLLFRLFDTAVANANEKKRQVESKDEELVSISSNGVP